MKINLFFYVTLLILIIIANVKADDCSSISGNPVKGTFTEECIATILSNYATYYPNGLFVIQISEEYIVYVQGYRGQGNMFNLQAAGPQFSKKITPDVLRALINLGWSLPDEDENYKVVLSIEQMLNGEAAYILYKTLDSYGLEQNQINLTYFMRNKWYTN